SDADWEAVRRGVKGPAGVVEEVVSRLLGHTEITPSALERHAAVCLSYLIATQQLELRFVLMPAGMYHKKQWLIRCGDHRVAVHGSGNTTVPGLFINGEQMTVERDWTDGDVAARRIGQLFEQFDTDWQNRRRNALTISADAAVRLLIDHCLRGDRRAPPTV